MLDALTDTSVIREANSSAVSWPAVAGGAFVAASLSLILLALGAGFGLSSISPWSNMGASASTVGAVAIAWLIMMQIISSAVGGYVAGRLRTKWSTLHNDEVHFRDTAHGLLVWSVGLVITAYFLTSAATTMVGGTAENGASSSSTSYTPNGYFIDTLFRSERPKEVNNPLPAAEVELIMANTLRQNEMPAADKAYLAQLVAARTGIAQPEAEKRVADFLTAVRQTADTARKATAHFLLWTFLAFLIGAFCASYAATIGGRQRDHVQLI